MRVALTSLKLLIAADNYFTVEFNGMGAPEWSGSMSLRQFELKPWALGLDAVLGAQENKLEINVQNDGGPGNLIYRLDFFY
jgi:hypothetical protein